MAISFTLNLTPNQIEFLQTLELYSHGTIPITDVADVSSGGHRGMFITWVHKLIREGLVEHVEPKERERYEGQRGDGKIIKAYRITHKGSAVLSIIEKDVEAFIERQKRYRETKKKASTK